MASSHSSSSWSDDGEKVAQVAADEKKKTATTVITLVSSDGEAFEVERSVWVQCGRIRNLIEEAEAVRNPGRTVLVHVATARMLSMVIQYCKMHAAGGCRSADELSAWDSKFIKLDYETLFDLGVAADYLNIKGLWDLMSKAMHARWL